MAALQKECLYKGSSTVRVRLRRRSDHFTCNEHSEDETVPGAAEESCSLKVGQGDNDAAAPSCFRPMHPRPYVSHAAWA